MTSLGLVFDLLLMALLIALSWLLLASKDLFRAIVLFISFGLLLSLSWARLGAPDIALAEAAIGAGITGALLLVGLGRLGSVEHCKPERTATGVFRRFSAPFLVAIITPSIAAILLLELRQLSPSSDGLVPLVQQQLGNSGTEHPVTAVLLNFRGYDTLLEIGVLMLALLSIWSLDRARPLFQQEQLSPVLQGLSRLLLPVLILASGLLLWRGGHAPGGAFQAGALLAAGILLAALIGHPLPRHWYGLPLRLLPASGFLVFLLIAAATLADSGLLLAYPEGIVKELILLIEVFATVSIAALLAAVVVGGHPPDKPYHGLSTDNDSTPEERP